MTGYPEVISSPVELVPRNGLVANMPLLTTSRLLVTYACPDLDYFRIADNPGVIAVRAEWKGQTLTPCTFPGNKPPRPRANRESGFIRIWCGNHLFPPWRLQVTDPVAATTVRQPLQKMGEIAARTLLDRIENRSEYVAEIAIEPELIVRQSTE
jgi:hypothetical protein